MSKYEIYCCYEFRYEEFPLNYNCLFVAIQLPLTSSSYKKLAISEYKFTIYLIINSVNEVPLNLQIPLPSVPNHSSPFLSL